MQAANAGLDQEFYEERYFASALKAAVQKGEVSEARIDDMVRRILRSLAAAGALDRAETVKPVDTAAGLAVAQRVAESGIVLLQNRNALLPLRAEGLRKIAVIGRRADIGVLAGGGSSLRRIDRRRHGGRYAARHARMRSSCSPAPSGITPRR